MPSRLAALLLAVLLAPALHAQSFQGLGFLDGSVPRPTSLGNEVSADGSVVVGSSFQFTPFQDGATEVRGRAFRWENGTMQALPLLGSMSRNGSYASGVSADGTRVVGVETSNFPGEEAVLWSSNGILTLNPLPGGNSATASAISADGLVVVGQSATGPYPSPAPATRWNSSPQSLGFLPSSQYSSAEGVSPDGSVVVGSSTFSGGPFAFREHAFRWQNGVMQDLGLLPGAEPDGDSYASAVSADGSIVVGTAILGSQEYAVRWVDGVIENLGEGRATDVSADGRTIVGYQDYQDADGDRIPFLWTEEDGRRDLRAVLVDSLGIDLDGWTLGEAEAISADGLVIVGNGTDPNGRTQAWRAVLASSFAVTTPAEDEIVPPGAPYTIRFSAPPDVSAVNLFVVRTLSPDGPRIPLAQGVPAAGGTYEWDIPEDLLSPSTFLVAVDAADASREAVSARFRVRDPWRLHRVAGTLQNPTYEPFVRETHVWNSTQTPDELWPRAYWNVEQNDYDAGRDPYYTPPAGAAAVRYGPLFTRVTGVYRLDSGAFEHRFLHPQWTAFANAFGTANVYRSLTPVQFGALYFNDPVKAAVDTWAARVVEGTYNDAVGTYRGACYGFVLSALAAFGDPDRFAARFPALPAGVPLGTLPLSDAARDAIHTAFSYQYGNDDLLERMRGDGHLLGGPPEDVRDFLRSVKTMFQLETRDQDFVVSFQATQLPENAGSGGVSAARKLGAHAVLAHRLERVEEGSPVFRLYIVDPNEPPGTDPYVVLDSLSNTWRYPNSGWEVGADAYIISSLETRFLFAPASPTWARSAARNRGGGALLQADVTAATSSMADADGHAVSYDGTTLRDTADGIYAWFEATGHGSEPSAFYAAPGAYTYTLGSGAGRRVGLRLSDGARSVGYARTGETGGMTDEVATGPDGLVRAAFSGDPASVVTAEASVRTDADERSLRASRLVSGDVGTLAVAPVGDAAFRLAGTGAASYTLELRRTSSAGVQQFSHAAVPLAAGAAHTVRPDWATLGSGPVLVDVDTNGDGIPDETLTLGNEVADEAGAGVPAASALAVAPNPARGAATLTLTLPVPAPVRVAVIDMLGREVARVHDGPLAAGTHALALDTRGLPAGAYVVRATTPAGVVSRRLTVVR